MTHGVEKRPIIDLTLDASSSLGESSDSEQIPPQKRARSEDLMEQIGSLLDTHGDIIAENWARIQSRLGRIVFQGN